MKFSDSIVAAAEPSGKQSARRLVRFPDLVVTRQRSKVVVENPAIGTRFLASPVIGELLEHLDRPRSLQAIGKRFGLSRADLAQPLDRFAIVFEDELDLFCPELSQPLPFSIGAPCRVGELHDVRAGRSGSPYVIVGAPVDVAGSVDAGARHGPWEVRSRFPHSMIGSELPRRGARPSGEPGRRMGPIVDLEMRRQYQAISSTVLDVGNVGYLPGEGIETFGRRLQRVIREVIRHDMRPVTIGGDHSITWPVLEVLFERHPALGILHFDAHHDLYPWTNRSTKRRLTHANPFVYVIERPSLAHLRQLGLRTLDRYPADLPPTRNDRVSYLSARELQGMSPEAALGDLPTSIPYYLSFDVDVMAPHLAPATGTPAVGGLSYYQVLDLLDHAFQRLRFVGADFVEVARGADPLNPAAQVVAMFLARFLLAGERSEPLEGHFPPCPA
jgi:arginase family enzyme